MHSFLQLYFLLLANISTIHQYMFVSAFALYFFFNAIPSLLLSLSKIVLFQQIDLLYLTGIKRKQIVLNSFLNTFGSFSAIAPFDWPSSLKQPLSECMEISLKLNIKTLQLLYVSTFRCHNELHYIMIVLR